MVSDLPHCSNMNVWKDFLAFHVVAGLPYYQVNTEILLSFMEFLHSNGLSANHIANYMAALRALHILFALQTDSFKDDRIPLFLKAVKIQDPLSVPTRSHIDIDTLSSIIALCDSFPHPQFLKLCISYVISPSCASPISCLTLPPPLTQIGNWLEQILFQFRRGHYFLLNGVRQCRTGSKR